MPRGKQLAITERQFEVMSILWEHGPLTVREIRDLLPRDKELPYTTVLGLLQVMEKESLVAHELEEQAHRYRPLLSRRQGTTRLVTDFVQRFFQGAAEKLVLGLVDARQLSPRDLRKLEAELGRKNRPSPAAAKPLPGKTRRRTP